nr:translation initiation factor IF-2-like [Equus asinus]
MGVGHAGGRGGAGGKARDGGGGRGGRTERRPTVRAAGAYVAQARSPPLCPWGAYRHRVTAPPPGNTSAPAPAPSAAAPPLRSPVTSGTRAAAPSASSAVAPRPAPLRTAAGAVERRSGPPALSPAVSTPPCAEAQSGFPPRRERQVGRLRDALDVAQPVSEDAGAPAQRGLVSTPGPNRWRPGPRGRHLPAPWPLSTPAWPVTGSSDQPQETRIPLSLTCLMAHVWILNPGLFLSRFL